MSITRIQNNQITDSTIVAYAKMQAGSLTGNLFAPTITLNSNVTINGNLFLSNTGNTTTINATNTYINDPIVVFNNGYTGSLTGYDIGMLVNRNLTSLAQYGSVNTAWVWSEADQAFIAIATTDTGTGAVSITNSGWANAKVGNSTVVTNQTVGGILTVAGATTLNTVTGASFQGIIGNATAAAGTFTSITGTSATVNGTLVATTVAAPTIGNVGASVTGNGGFLSNIIAANIGGPVATANVALYDNVTSSSTNANYYVEFVNATSGNVATYTNSSLTYNPGTGVLAATTFSGSVSGGTGNFTTLNATSGLTASTVQAATIGNVGTALNGTLSGTNVSGTVATANVSIYDNVTTTTTNATFYPQIVDKSSGNVQTYTATGVNINPSTSTISALAFTGGSGAFTTLNATGITQITNSTAATSYNTGALQVTGGVGIGGNLFVNGNVYTNNIFGVTQDIITIQDPLVYLQALGNLSLYNYDIGLYSDYSAPGYRHTGIARSFASNTWTFFSNLASEPDVAGVNWNDVGIAYDTVKAGSLILANSTAATTTTSGALQVTGGVGIGGAIYAGSIQNTPIGSTTASTAQFTTVDATTLRAATIGNAGANAQFGFVTATTLNAATIGNASATGQFGTITATTLNAATIGNTSAAHIGATTTLTGLLTAATVNAATIGNTGATLTGATLTTSSTIISGGNVVITSGVDTTSTTTGALLITGTGGASIASNVYVGNNLYIGATALAQQASFANPTIIAVDSGSNYAQIALKNTNANGSADFAGYADNGTDAGGWVDVGMAGSTYSDPNYTITKPQDGSLMVRPTNNTYGGNLILATSEAGSYNDIVIGVGSFFSNSEVARFHGNTSNSGYLNLAYTTNQTGAATLNSGAFRVQGGASFSGNVYHGGGAVFNGSQSSNYDFKVAGVNTTNLLWARPNSTYDTVIIGGTLSPASIVNGAKLAINSTDTILLPVGTSAQRPTAAGTGTDTAGMFRYNTTLNAIEYYGGGTPGWQSVTSSFTVIADQQFNGTGAQVNFTLSSNAQTTASCIVSINGVVQIPTLAYSVSGSTLTFTEAPVNGDVIDVRMLTTTTTVTNITSLNGYNAFQVDNSGSYIYSGASGQNLQYTIEPVNGAMVTNGSNVTIASAGTSVVDNLWANSYSSAEYTVTATLTGTNIREISKVHMIHNGGAASAGTATVAVYGIVSTSGNSLVTWGATTSGNIAQLQATTTNANTILRIKRNYQAI